MYYVMIDTFQVVNFSLICFYVHVCQFSSVVSFACLFIGMDIIKILQIVIKIDTY